MGVLTGQQESGVHGREGADDPYFPMTCYVRVLLKFSLDFLMMIPEGAKLREHGTR